MEGTQPDLKAGPTNIYSQIAIALKGGDLRQVGLVNLAARIAVRVPRLPIVNNTRRPSMVASTSTAVSEKEASGNESSTTSTVPPARCASRNRRPARGAHHRERSSPDDPVPPPPSAVYLLTSGQNLPVKVRRSGDKASPRPKEELSTPACDRYRERIATDNRR
eukprot:4150260-Prymnesium_polylepis.1